MATIIAQPPGSRGRKLHTVKIDMTPMVDLGFLLITFFIFTTSLSAPTVTKLNMPKKETEQTADVYVKTLLSVVFGGNNIFVYEGDFSKALRANAIQPASFDARTGLGNIIRKKQQLLEKENLRDDLTVLLKPLPSATYQDLLNALDEMQINGVKRYAVIGAAAAEKSFVETVAKLPPHTGKPQ